MKIKTTREIALAIIFSVLYAVAVIALAPISFSIFQIRIADSLLPLAIIFGWSAIIGITMGTIVANFFGGLGVIDVVGGAAANFVATLLAWKIGRKGGIGDWILAIAMEVLVVTLIVGGYLSYLFNMPLSLALFGILVGSLIAIGFLGYVLLKLMSRKYVVNILRTFGLKLSLEEKD